MDQSNSRVADSFFKLRYEVMEATSALMHLLQGAELVRATRDQESAPAHAEDERRRFAPDPPLINVTVEVDIPSSKSTGVINQGGLAEQLAFKGWVEQLYNIIWERRFRGDSYNNLQLPSDLQGQANLDKKRPTTDVVGEFRLIRNDLVHTGVATPGRTGKCNILQWFKPGDLMVLSTDHVFDFINQMGFMTRTGAHDPTGSVARLIALPTLDGIPFGAPTKRIISVRQSSNHLEEGSARHLTSVVFEDGVYIHKESTTLPQGIPAKGDVNPTLYDEAVDILLGRRTGVGGYRAHGSPLATSLSE